MGRARMKIGVLTAGGDCPGLNAAIRGVGKTAVLKYGHEIIGFSSGFLGLIRKEYRQLDELALSGILTVGGTILGSSREKPFKHTEYDDYIKSKPEIIQENYRKLSLDGLVCIGGNGTQKTAYRLSKLGLNVVGIPKTIDNDVWGTDLTFGFDSAVSIAAEAIDRLHSTANSHKRIMVVEVMGHTAGWLALHAGLAGGGDIILIPEIEYSTKVIAEYLTRRFEEGKPYSIVVVAEGITLPNKKNGSPRNVPVSAYIANQILKRTGLETRGTILGYIQRGGSPTARDRIVATEFGAYAAEMIHRGEYGKMAAYKGYKLVGIPLSDVAGKTKTIPRGHTLILHARSLGTCFGDSL
ncbi:6-phosphofructokinase [Olavius algarvensis spirochete endosymbiont]|uniref:6-phosphofructokinase n=1 Tax=Olavius algarvensis spirochete endosymbiont TaxID=260710 RepID=UPI000A6AAC81|nr:ATP-dependent 6-phosphofructokinase [Olavius algarvensis spirochete endosymbiont]CAD7838326.1 MAG: 6-phosphofructokinase (EC 2.7.1.11) [Olavius algarvensis spirochete endosymbiont]VDB00031.1 6-phosphofructokinase [Olavius algarvensis spirochete endosymbiont]